MDALRLVDPHLKVAIIAGMVGAPGEVEPEGCVVDGTNEPSASCVESGGLSNYTNDSAGQLCSNSPTNPTNDPTVASIIAARSCNGVGCSLPCCGSDAADRYAGFTAALEGGGITESICRRSLNPLIDAALITGSADIVEFAREPSPDAFLRVVVSRQSGVNEDVPELGDEASCAIGNGWLRIGGRRLAFCGAARPVRGDSVAIHEISDPNVQPCP